MICNHPKINRTKSSQNVPNHPRIHQIISKVYQNITHNILKPSGKLPNHTGLEVIQRQDLAAVVSWTWFWGVHLEDHPRTRKWLITMVSCCPLNGVIPLINGRTSWLIYGGDPKYLLSGMILQASIENIRCTWRIIPGIVSGQDHPHL